jgi:hypothetical protein
MIARLSNQPSRTRLLAVVGLLCSLGVVLAAAGSSFGAGSGRTTAAATHCTRYAPVVSQDVNCDLKGTMYSTGTYSTPSVALRDSNRIDVDASRSLAIRYGSGSWIFATGTSLSQGASSGYQSAQCAIGGAAVNGRCRTNWHD